MTAKPETMKAAYRDAKDRAGVEVFCKYCGRPTRLHHNMKLYKHVGLQRRQWCRGSGARFVPPADEIWNK